MVRLAKASSYWMEDDSVEVAVRGAYLKQFGFDGLIIINPIEEKGD